MNKYNFSFKLLLVYFLETAYSNNILTPAKGNKCEKICESILIPAIDESNSICQRGCRIFNLIDANGSDNLNKTKNECLLSCFEAYKLPDFEACKLGCFQMHKTREVEISQGFFLLIEQSKQNNFMILQPDIDQFDLDIITDPELQGQLDVGYSIEYKIPETRIRTMPININNIDLEISSDITFKQYHTSENWLDCTSNFGFSRWLLGFSILLAILLGFWLLFVSEKKKLISNLPLNKNCLIEILPPSYEETISIKKPNFEICDN